jgi:drug/metabolite transporter (DMT)-like permease
MGETRRPLLARSLKGSLYMLAAAALVSVLHALVRRMGSELHPFEVAFFRNIVMLMLMLPILLRLGRGAWVSRRPGLQALRGIIGTCAMMSWFYGLALVPIADATALNFSTAIFLTIGAVLILGERVGPRRWAAVAAGFAGALVILRPGLQTVTPGVIVVIGSSVLWAGSLVSVKILSRSDGSATIVFYSSVYFTALSLVPALIVWQWPSLPQLLVLCAIGGLGTLAHLLLTQAYHEADATALTPIDFTRLIWTALLGYLMFDEFPDLWTWLGGGVIIASASFIAYREAALRRRGPTRPLS